MNLAWLNTLLKIAPMIISVVSPALAPLAGNIVTAVMNAENSNKSGLQKLDQVVVDMEPTIATYNDATKGDLRKAISAAVDATNVIHNIVVKDDVPSITTK